MRLTMETAGNVVALISPCIFIPVLTYGLGVGKSIMTILLPKSLT